MPWGLAITIFLRRHSMEVHTIEKAAALLLERWPAAYQHSAACVDAHKACLAALEGVGTAENARLAFLKAAEEAGILAMAGL